MQTTSLLRRSSGAISRSGRDPRFLTLALLILLLVLVWGLVGLLVHLQHSDADRANVRRAQALASTLAPQIEGRIVRLEWLAGDLLARSSPDIGDAGFERLAAEADLPDEVQRLSLVDPQGQVIAQVSPRAGKLPQPLLIESQRRPPMPQGLRVIVSADASRLLALAAGAPFRLEGVALLTRGNGPLLGAYPDSPPFRPAGSDASPAWPTANDGLDRQWADMPILRQGLRLLVAVTSADVDSDLQRRTTLVVAAATIESGVAVTLAMLVLAQARRRDRLLHRLEIGRRRLRLANLAKTRFLQSISHELRTPLNGVLCTSELMVQLAMNDEQAQVADIICQSASDLAGMIDMLIDIADLQSGSAKLAQTPTDIRRVIETTSKSSLSAIWSRGGSLTLRWSPGLANELLIDPVRLAGIVKALLDAAVNVYAGPAITLVASQEQPAELSLGLTVRPAEPPDGERPVELASQAAGRALQAAQSIDSEDLKAALGLLLLQDLLTALGGSLNVSVTGAHEHQMDVRLPVRTAQESPP